MMIYRFRNWEVDIRTHQLRRSGEAVEIEPKGFELLHYLLENRERLVSRDELLDACWSRKYVSEAVLTTSMGRVRRLLDPTPDPDHPVIQTVWGKGYRWMLEVSATEPATEPLPVTEDATEVRTEQPLPTPSATATWQGIESRLLTVMSCTLSDNAGTEPDWEEQHLKIQHFRHSISNIIEPFQGYLSHHNYPTLLVYFGYPQAHEDDARRAILSALQLLNRLPPQRLEARIGIHTGPAIIEFSSEGNHQEPIVTGETLSIASELCRLAAPAGVVISASSVQLAGWDYDWKTLPPLQLPGYSERLPVYRLVPPAQPLGSTPAMRHHLTPFIERVVERVLLQERWTQAREGYGQTVLLSGEAGIGKSRLLMMLKQQIKQDPAHYLESQCSPYQQNTSLAPVVMLLQQLLQWQSEDSAEMKLQTLQALLETYTLPLEQNLPLLADLFSLKVPEHYPPLTLEPRQRQQLLLELLLALVLQHSHHKPLLLVIEDLHWADPSTLEWLNQLIAQVPAVPLLLVLSTRPDFTPNWRAASSITSIVLERFMPDQIRRMLTGITGGKGASPALQKQIIEKTDGVPMFIEELMQSLLESGQLHESREGFELSADLNTLPVPTNLQGLLMARLDRLAEAKEIAHWGAVIGREFSYRLLAAATAWDEAILARQLQQLLNSGLVFQRGVGQQARYLFKHALVQEAAYRSMLKRQRQQMHQRVAQVLEHRKATGEEVAPERLAQHYSEAGEIDQAIIYWQQAGEAAAARFSLREAQLHFKQALTLLKQQEDNPKRQQQELNLQMLLQQTH